MITENKRGEELFFEVYRDFTNFTKKELQRRRDKLRLSLKKKQQKELKDVEWISFTCMSPAFNSWYVKTGMVGDVNKPKAINHYHCTTNAGPGGSKLYVIFRGNKSAILAKGNGGGYVVSVNPHVLKRMRERNKEAFGDITNNDILCEKIFTLEEEGIYYDFDWPSIKKKESEVVDIFDLTKNIDKPVKVVRNKVETVPIILKTLAGLFLGYATKDRSEVRLITYITSEEIEDEEEKDLVKNFLEPAWICYNFRMHEKEKVEETYKSLMKYMEDKTDRNVYRLVI